MAELPTTCSPGDLRLRESAPALLPLEYSTPDQEGLGISFLRMEDGRPTVNLLLAGRPPGTAPNLHVGDRFRWGKAEWEVSGICAGAVELSVVQPLPASTPTT